MAVSDETAIRYSNEWVRTGADLLAKAYYDCDRVRDRWDALGGGQPAIDQMEADIRAAADRLLAVYEHSWRSEKIWFVLGGTSLIPNDSAQEIWDNSSRTAQDSNRPLIHGANVNNLVTRQIEFQNWLLSALGDFTDPLRNSVAYVNTIIAASTWGPTVMSLADADNFMTRCSELRSNYEASSNASLNTILAVAVNPALSEAP